MAPTVVGLFEIAGPNTIWIVCTLLLVFAAYWVSSDTTAISWANLFSGRR